MDRIFITTFLKKTRLYKPLRWLYNFILRFRKQTEVTVCDQRLTFWTPTFYLDNYIKNLAGEKKVLEAFINILSPADIVWDIGANIGLFSIASANTVGTGGVIYAFEPEKKSFSLLKRNIALNKSDNIIPFPFALGDTNTNSMLYASDSPNFGAHSFVKRTDYQLKRKGTAVPMHTGDSLVKTGVLQIPTVIKIDVEGAEVRVIKGMQKILEDKKLRILMCEVHTNLIPLFGDSPDYIESALQNFGFSIKFRHQRGLQYHLLFSRM